MEFTKAMQKAFVVSISSQRSETTHAANLVLPALTAYESWGDAFPRNGVRSIQQPVMTAVNMFDAKAREDILLNAVQEVNKNAFSGITSYLDYLQNKWRKIQSEIGNTDNFENFWISVLENGGIFKNPEFSSVKLSRKVTSGKVNDPGMAEKDGLTLLPISSILHGDGSGANKPWLQEVPNPISQIVWDSWVEINPDTAQKMGLMTVQLLKCRRQMVQYRLLLIIILGFIGTQLQSLWGRDISIPEMLQTDLALMLWNSFLIKWTMQGT